MSDASKKTTNNPQEKLDQLKHWEVINPLIHVIPDFLPDTTSMMYWGITYTKQLHGWLKTLIWETAPDNAYPDISFLELYINFR